MANTFERKISDALKQVRDEQNILFLPLNDWAHMLVVPPAFKYSIEETREIAREIQQTILPNQTPEHHRHLLSWQQIVNDNHLNPAISESWKNSAMSMSDADAKLMFFIDTQPIHAHLEEALLLTGLNTTNKEFDSRIVVSDGHFDEDIHLLEIASACLWSAQDIQTAASSYVKDLHATFRLYHTFSTQLKKKFPETSFFKSGHELCLMHDKLYGSINYRAAIKSMRCASQRLDAWLASISLSDLLALDEPSVISLRAPSFVKATPKGLSKAKDGHVLVVEHEAQGRLLTVTKSSALESEPLRFAYYYNESRRHLSKRHFAFHAYLSEGSPWLGALFVGDKAASIAAFPELLHGALRKLAMPPKTLRVLSSSENILIAVDSNAPWSLIEHLEHKAKILQCALFPDGADPLHLDCHMQLSDNASGEFESHLVPAPFFELVETADDLHLALPPGRGDYLKGLAYELIHQWPFAVQAFQRAFAYDSKDGDISYALGRSMTESGRFQDSLVFLERAFNELPEDAEVANSLGLAYLECEQKENAARMLEHAAHMQPDDAQILSNLGRCYFANKKFKDAERVLAQALDRAPNFSQAHATMAQVRWRLGDVDTARKHARRAFAANPANKCVQDLLWALTVDASKTR